MSPPREITREQKALLLASIAAIAVVTLAFGLGALISLKQAPHSGQAASLMPVAARVSPESAELINHGHELYQFNCAHCHSDDATGDEGPSLFNLKKSDARLAKLIKQGIKGEMPSFGKKFKDDEVTALIAFLHSLKS